MEVLGRCVFLMSEAPLYQTEELSRGTVFARSVFFFFRISLKPEVERSKSLRAQGEPASVQGYLAHKKTHPP